MVELSVVCLDTDSKNYRGKRAEVKEMSVVGFRTRTFQRHDSTSNLNVSCVISESQVM